MGQKLDNYAIEACAKIGHEANRLFCEVMGDYSHRRWEDTSDDLKQVARQAVIGIAEHDYNAQQSHEAWVTAKRAAGWAYGQQKDVDKKLHPCMVEWAQLPFEQQHKDLLWINSVKSMLAAIYTIPQ